MNNKYTIVYIAYKETNEVLAMSNKNNVKYINKGLVKIKNDKHVTIWDGKDYQIIAIKTPKTPTVAVKTPKIQTVAKRSKQPTKRKTKNDTGFTEIFGVPKTLRFK